MYPKLIHAHEYRIKLYLFTLHQIIHLCKLNGGLFFTSQQERDPPAYKSAKDAGFEDFIFLTKVLKYFTRKNYNKA